MFSGLIVLDAEVVEARDDRGGRRLVIASPGALSEGVVLGDSIAVNGVCLTAVALDDDLIAFDVVPETLERSTLGTLTGGERVNLELSLRVGDRIGGHFVYGHVDSTTDVLAKEPEGQGFRVRFATPPNLARYLPEKGYVALDGVSLTVASAERGSFSIAMIPETAARTTLGMRGPGDRVNLEIDPLARYALASIAE